MSTDLRILYVDDDDDIRTIASMALRIDGGIEVRAVSSGQEALDLLSREAWRPDVIVLDVMMPGMDGFALHAALRRREDLAGAKTIFMTARASRAGLEEYVATGADGVILKPFDPLNLAREVRAVVSRPG
ncbi:CheY-like chemotaxis protein [Novosphingobium chloroacetimidivorans]|uniref:CheY-like chemotaxis protein n=1 Tax=Novosphingobium chloroacetimidivorans TaxID=1428314 RepID=A0A7W7KB61_9SPHN|nr:response regulator [Novosphingobium chloroacetimidivorans]MBB4859587.1 CheY-like chemotaxis protein [Novosphingobium chloroacetimidivorans]